MIEPRFSQLICFTRLIIIIPSPFLKEPDYSDGAGLSDEEDEDEIKVSDIGSTAESGDIAHGENESFYSKTIN